MMNININLTTTEAKLLLYMLELSSDLLSCRGCNDLDLKSVGLSDQEILEINKKLIDMEISEPPSNKYIMDFQAVALFEIIVKNALKEVDG